MTAGRRLGFVAVLLALGLGWGSTQSLGKIAVSSGHGHLALIFWQCVVGTLVLGAILALRRKTVPVSRRTLAFAALIAIIGTIIPTSTFYLAVEHLPAGVMSILISTIPIFAFPIALALGSDHLSLPRVTGLLLGLAGVALIGSAQGGGAGGALSPFWLAVGLIGPLCYAVEGNIVAKWGTAGLDPVQAMCAAFVVGAVLLFPAVLVRGEWFVPGLPWGAPERALVLSSVIHAFMYAAYVWLARSAGAVFATQTSYLVTAAGIGWAMLLLGERFPPQVWLALGVILIGVMLVRPRASTSTAAA